ncbi:hypothetical protein TRVL_08104 [Trypanosoma vivax]|nr:hypothetical protein TRVL_08104 [Trypanosoma vivax]
MRADSFSSMGRGDLLPLFENKHMEFMDLQNATNSTETPKSGNYGRAFEAAQECFQNKRRAHVLPLQQVALMAQRRTLANPGARFYISSDTLKATKPTAVSS